MSLSLRISLIIGGIAVLIASAVASMNYRWQLNEALSQGQNLVRQMAENAKGTSDIAAYLVDPELATEIVSGMEGSDLITGASIVSEGATLAQSGDIEVSESKIAIALNNPFDETQQIGLLNVYPDNQYIQKQAAASGRQTTITLLGLSAIIAIILGIFVNIKLTKPLRQLSKEFERIDTAHPENMEEVNIQYGKKDEIGRLVEKTNNLIGALKARFNSEKALRESTEELQKRFRLLFEQATAGIALISKEGRVTLANPAFNELFSSQTEDSMFADYFTEADKVNAQLNTLVNSSYIDQVDVDLIVHNDEKKRYFHCLFSSILDSRGLSRSDSEHLIEVIIYDITERREKELKARYEADHDSLTGLMNRRSGQTSLERVLTETKLDANIFALMMIDLDKFKPINDTYGHDAGDIVLQTISQRIKALLKNTDSVFVRWGGDEFLLGIALPSESKIKMLSEKVLSEIGQDVDIQDGLVVSVGASIGVVLSHTSQTSTVKSLVKQADNLMYKIKQQGRNQFQFEKAY